MKIFRHFGLINLIKLIYVNQATNKFYSNTNLMLLFIFETTTIVHVSLL